jgi:hypothetical protein
MEETPVVVARNLQKLGWREVVIGIPGAALWWTDDKHGVMPWTEALTRVFDSYRFLIAASRHLQAQRPKSFFRTSEFWLALSGTSASATVLITSFTGALAGVFPAPYDKVPGVLSAALMGLLSVGYTFIRNVAKAKVDQDAKAVELEPALPPVTPPPEVKP